MAELFTNNASSTLLSGISSSILVLTLASGEGSKFPNPTAPDYFRATLLKKTTGEIEIVKVTARVGDVLTIERDLESTSAYSFLAGDIVELRPTAGMLALLQTEEKALEGSPNYNVDTGAADAYVITPSPAITDYVAGQTFNFKAVNASTGASTIDVNGLGVKTIKRLHDLDIAAGDIESGGIYTIQHDGTNFQLLSNTSNIPMLDLANVFANTSHFNKTSYLKVGSAVETASTVTLAIDGNISHWTGTNDVDDITHITGDGPFYAICDDVFILKHVVGKLELQGQADITTAINDRFVLIQDGTTWMVVNYDRADGKSMVASNRVLLASASASNSASIDFDSEIDFSAYDKFILQIIGLQPAANATSLFLRMSIDAGSTYKAGGADYKWTKHYSYNGVHGGNTSLSASEITLNTGGCTNDNNLTLNGEIEIYMPSVASYVTMIKSAIVQTNTLPSVEFNLVTGHLNDTTNDVDGLRILMNIGNISVGELLLYGEQT